MRHFLNGLICAAGLGLGVLAGGASCDKADEIFDCQSVCSKYKECIQSDYDVGGCRSRCSEKSEKDTDFRRKADVCEACISNRSCTGATFNCATECAGIVP